MRRSGSRPKLRYNCLGVLIMAAPARSVKPAEYMFKCSAARPADGDNWYRLLFYNIGWNVTSKKPRHTMEGMATEICSMVHCKCVDAVGISEVFNLKDDMWQQRRVIMRVKTQQQCCTACDLFGQQCCTAFVDRPVRWPLDIHLELK